MQLGSLGLRSFGRKLRLPPPRYRKGSGSTGIEDVARTVVSSMEVCSKLTPPSDPEDDSCVDIATLLGVRECESTLEDASGCGRSRSEIESERSLGAMTLDLGCLIISGGVGTMESDEPFEPGRSLDSPSRVLCAFPCGVVGGAGAALAPVRSSPVGGLCCRCSGGEYVWSIPNEPIEALDLLGLLCCTCFFFFRTDLEGDGVLSPDSRSPS